MKIKDILFAQGATGFYFDDQQAIKKGATLDGFFYRGTPLTKGFSQVRQAGESILIMVLLENGQVALGDCAAVQYSGAAGRDPLFLAESHIPLLNQWLRPQWQGAKLGTFREMCASIDEFRIEGKALHTAVRYGMSMALLQAAASASNKMACEVVCAEYDLPLIAEPIAIFGQSGDNRYDNADKMIIKECDVMSHGLFNNVEEKLGRQGEKLRDYLRWLTARIRHLRRREDYRPALHMDLYGTLGIAFDNNISRIVAFLASLEEVCDGLPLFIEGPVDMGGRDEQIEALAAITRELKRCGSPVAIVADEWCNTVEDIRLFADAGAGDMLQIKAPDLGCVNHVVEAILYCRERRVMAYLGGSCNETDLSARLSMQLAMAARADRLLAKPGMGFDEAFFIVKNEMARIITLLSHKMETCG